MGRTKVGTAKANTAKEEPTEQKTRLQAIIKEEAAKLLNAMQTEEMRHKDFCSVEEFLASRMSELFKNALERYRQEQAETQT